jgi:hypothetical protein
LSRWFRFYDDVLDDYEVSKVPAESFRAYVFIMACVSKHGAEILSDKKSLAWLLRLKSEAELDRVMQPLFDRELIGADLSIKHFSVPSQQRCNTPEWAIIRARIFERDKFTCRYCGERGGRLECDHVVPHSKGGRDDDDNLVTACFPCNRSKRDKTVEEWLGTNPLNKA